MKRHLSAVESSDRHTRLIAWRLVIDGDTRQILNRLRNRGRIVALDVIVIDAVRNRRQSCTWCRHVNDHHSKLECFTGITLSDAFDGLLQPENLTASLLLRP